jgi:hypothetical protein
MSKISKGKEPMSKGKGLEKKKKIALHMMRKPLQRTLPWVMETGIYPPCKS